MKHTKHHNGFNHRTGYNVCQSHITYILNKAKNENKQKTKKNFLNILLIKLTSFGRYHCYTHSWYFFTKDRELTEGSSAHFFSKISCGEPLL